MGQPFRKPQSNEEDKGRGSAHFSVVTDHCQKRTPTFLQNLEALSVCILLSHCRMGLEINKMGESPSAMENAKALIAKKDSIEAQIRELQAELRIVS
jgi:hypothetical protein